MGSKFTVSATISPTLNFGSCAGKSGEGGFTGVKSSSSIS